MEVRPPFEVFYGLDGQPLEDGYVYIGEQGKSPILNPLPAYWDEDLTIPATNIRITNGYATLDGNPAQVYTKDPYSLLVQDANLQTVYFRSTSQILEKDIVLTQVGEEYTLTNDDVNVNLTVAPQASSCRVAQTLSKRIIRGLSDSTTPGPTGYLDVRPGQALRLTRTEGSTQYSGVFEKTKDPAIAPAQGRSSGWSPDGRYLVVGSAGVGPSYFTIYDWKSGLPVKVPDPETGVPEAALGVSWSPDGRYLAISHGVTPFITIYDWSSGSPVKIADPATLPPDTGRDCSWSPDGRYLAVAHDNSPELTIYDWESGSPVKIANPTTLPTGTGRGVDWSPDGRYLAVAHDTTPFITIYDWSSGSPVKITNPATLPTSDGEDATWSPDGRYLAVPHTASPYVTIYDWSSGAPVKIANPATLPTGARRMGAWSPDGRYLTVVGDTTPFVTIYDWDSGSPVKITDPSVLPEVTSRGVSWSPDGKYLVCGSSLAPFIIIYEVVAAAFDTWTVQHIDGPEILEEDFV